MLSIQEGALTGKFNATYSIFLSKNDFDMKDKKEVEQTVDNTFTLKRTLVVEDKEQIKQLQDRLDQSQLSVKPDELSDSNTMIDIEPTQVIDSVD